jgi:hypothetical protein
LALVPSVGTKDDLLSNNLVEMASQSLAGLVVEEDAADLADFSPAVSTA